MTISLENYPQLKLIAWNRREGDSLSESEALSLYERNWSYVDQNSLSDHERAFIEHLVKTVGNGVFHV
ncbi:hypothetical protein CL689_06265 [Candidatus Saccharibacteria bacterium]|nr:hypothetical protein [Candidatus Saccharibacteria bacterium]